MYNLLEVLVWGCRSRTYKRWIYGKRLKRKQRQRFNELGWLLPYGLPIELFKGERPEAEIIIEDRYTRKALTDRKTLREFFQS